MPFEHREGFDTGDGLFRFVLSDGEELSKIRMGMSLKLQDEHISGEVKIGDGGKDGGGSEANARKTDEEGGSLSLSSDKMFSVNAKDIAFQIIALGVKGGYATERTEVTSPVVTEGSSCQTSASKQNCAFQ